MSTRTQPAVPPHTTPAVAFPTETEIYLLPSGEVIIADLPIELLSLTKELGAAVASGVTDVPGEQAQGQARRPAAHDAPSALPPSP